MADGGVRLAGFNIVGQPGRRESRQAATRLDTGPLLSQGHASPV